jgi:FAD/FMN-containing dehydrogenase
MCMIRGKCACFKAKTVEVSENLPPEDHMCGELIRPNDSGYDAARKVWNGMVDKYPVLIIRCADQADVISAIRFAQSQHLSVAVRSGGHSLCGSSVCNGGMVIDLSGMKDICIDPARRTARAQAGLTLGEFVRATQAFGLATTTDRPADDRHQSLLLRIARGGRTRSFAGAEV